MSMKPHEIYNAIEDLWKLSAVHTMALDLIASGKQQPNPAAYTYPMQHKAWDRVTTQMRTILDELERLGKGSKASPLAPPESSEEGSLSDPYLKIFGIPMEGSQSPSPEVPRLDLEALRLAHREGYSRAYRDAKDGLEYRADFAWENSAPTKRLRATLEAPKPEAPDIPPYWNVKVTGEKMELVPGSAEFHGNVFRDCVVAPEASPVVDPAPLVKGAQP